MPETNYSEAQKKAITSFGGSMALSAGAGSGKTTVLVERFLHAVCFEGALPERILAITFTERAADEMKTRLVRLCEERGLHAIRRRIEGAWIGTIDSFCARILKEHPIEAGIDPAFQIMGEGEAEILMTRMMDEVFEAESLSPGWLKIIAEMGENEIRSFFKDSAIAARSEDSFAESFKPKVFPELEKTILDRLALSLLEVMELTEGKDLTETLSNMREGSSILLSLMKDAPFFSDWETFEKVASALGLFSLRVKKLKSVAEDVKELGAQWLAHRIQSMSMDQKNEITQVFWKFYALYQGEKEKQARYDFADLLYYACRFLSGESEAVKTLRLYYRDYFQHIFVDEYQDTNSLQARLFGLIQNGSNLFVVGDLRQSIYGFRGAKPEIFKKALQECHRYELADNYRSRPEIIDLVNNFFKKILPEDIYSPLEACKLYKDAAKDPLEVLCVVKDGEVIENQKDARVQEARMIADNICDRVSSGMAYGDIAILFRTMTDSHYYEKELVDHRIPYRLVKGKGFYDKPEVKDLIHFLKILDNPTLDVSLACVLRSPLFGLSDDGLYWLSQYAKDGDESIPLWRGIKLLPEMEKLTLEDRDILQEFDEFYQSVESRKDRLSISEILETLSTQRKLESKLLSLADGKQSVANTRKFIEAARDLRASGVLGISDFIRYIESLAEKETVEAEAKIEPEKGNAVTLSSIHAAKGLEFPCVIIADMGKSRTRQSHTKMAVSEEFGIAGSLKNPFSYEFEKDYTLIQMMRESADREKAESDRLFYVAMTRAQEKIVFSGSVTWDSKEGAIKKDLSWMSRFLTIAGCEKLESGRGRLGDLEFPIHTDRSRVEAALRLCEPEVREFIDEKLIAGLLERSKIRVKPYAYVSDASVTELLGRDRGEEEPYRPELGFSDEENVPRNEFGTLYHKAMELSLLRIRSGQVITRDYFDSLLKGLSIAEKEEIVSSVFGFWKSSLGESIRTAQKCYPELPFIYKTPHGLLKGQIDLVYQTPSGEWVVLDYKTNRLKVDDKAAVAKSYEFQLALYALVFRDLLGVAPTKGMLYFSVIDQTFEYVYSSTDFEKTSERLLKVFLPERKQGQKTGV